MVTVSCRFLLTLCGSLATSPASLRRSAVDFSSAVEFPGQGVCADFRCHLRGRSMSSTPKRKARVLQPSIKSALAGTKKEIEELEPAVKKLHQDVKKVAKSEGELDIVNVRSEFKVVEEVHKSRVRVLKEGDGTRKGPILYWMSRDQRSRDNWALLYAVQEAKKRGVSVAVVFNLVDNFLDAKARHFGFMLRGLRVVEKNLQAVEIPFFLFRGKAQETIPAFAEECGASVVVMDFSPMRIGRVWREELCANSGPSVAVHEVDAHNVVPVWEASPKLEYGARTIRTKIHKLLPEYLTDFPILKNSGQQWTSTPPPPVKWDELIDDVLSIGAEVPEVDWCVPGEDAAMEHLLGSKNGFLTKRLAKYEFRNDPTKTSSLSNISPYLHYGQIAPQRAALECRNHRKQHLKMADSFFEELVVRRELSENFCYYQPNYDNVKGAWDWAQKSLREHASDKREFVYTQEQLEKGKTHETLWNAAQLEMVHYGKMHGFMRMYWAKKILEWTESPEEALRIAIYLNDKYELDGRDPNGYVGCMWSICGIHDQGWKERPVFGKIRYMNLAGCKRKFNVDGYVAYVDRLVSLAKKKAKDSVKIAAAHKMS
ncbi:hypothetical protein MPTK1_3g20600 [Marchantia polymorpha subsp. ruderalis]|uniref:Deoxyribodipyrimidine photo-lyase n=2 Tax=Marchantia polymorpha TaxID=3197 RepID=A0AAF6B2Z3_MARPO|nr:hypothetical protein MARPO_0149s0026 [Marchantia polymorpha]BAO57737.1 cyclobutane pyrimidine dimer photolyase [Marchantia polymorpha]BBN06377.1 hypothetical protein Mp_3g20600 [Marchantia polymorpha subsp. ruderalis]|eukprot:PTQ29033.1 hypothetical protein MARPO_0149s0026 [Marchantia polymorpha]